MRVAAHSRLMRPLCCACCRSPQAAAAVEEAAADQTGQTEGRARQGATGATGVWPCKSLGRPGTRPPDPSVPSPIASTVMLRYAWMC